MMPRRNHSFFIVVALLRDQVWHVRQMHALLHFCGPLRDAVLLPNWTDLLHSLTTYPACVCCPPEEHQ